MELVQVELVGLERVELVELVGLERVEPAALVAPVGLRHRMTLVLRQAAS